jgi:hypothetical protein
LSLSKHFPAREFPSLSFIHQKDPEKAKKARPPLTSLHQIPKKLVHPSPASRRRAGPRRQETKQDSSKILFEVFGKIPAGPRKNSPGPWKPFIFLF